MSRNINIGYRASPNAPETTIEIRAPYFLFGTQETSRRFWSLPIWKQLGVIGLAELGHTDPVYFIGWEMMAALGREIRLFQDNIARIDFDPDFTASWLSHLTYCYNLLILSAPSGSIPELTIG